MPDIVVEERPDSPIARDGRDPSVELRFLVIGTTDELAARQALFNQTAATYDFYGSGLVQIPRLNVEVKPLSYIAHGGIWDGVVHYGRAAAIKVVSFDTTGGAEHISQSIQTIAAYGRPGTSPPNFHGAIGVTPEGRVEGVDVPARKYEWTEQHRLADEFVTPGWRMLVAELTGKVNSAIFRNFPIGTVWFGGAVGAQNGNGEWEVTCKFAYSPNTVGRTIGDITGIAKKGWEYLWVLYQDEADEAAKRVVQRPVAVYVEQVLEYADLNLLQLGS